MFPEIPVPFVGFSLNAYTVLHLAGYVSFVVVGLRLLHGRPELRSHIWILGGLLVLGDLSCAHAAYRVGRDGLSALFVLQNWNPLEGPYWGSPLWFACLTGVYLLVRRLPVFPLLDVVSVAWPVAYVFFKFACLSKGCCGGYLCYAFWAKYFDGRHPIQLYEMLLLAATAGATFMLFRHQRLRGSLVLVVGLCFGFGRFLFAELRAMPTFGVGRFSMSQVIALGVGVFCLVLLAMNHTRQGDGTA